MQLWHDTLEKSCTDPRLENKRQSVSGSNFQCESNIAMCCCSIHRSPFFTKSCTLYILFYICLQVWHDTLEKSKRRALRKWRTCIWGVKARTIEIRLNFEGHVGDGKLVKDKLFVPQFVSKWVVGHWPRENPDLTPNLLWILLAGELDGELVNQKINQSSISGAIVIHTLPSLFPILLCDCNHKL